MSKALASSIQRLAVQSHGLFPGITIYRLSNDKNFTASYKVYAPHLSNFGSMSHALRWLRKGNRFRRISRRQASQLPRRCDIPAAWVPYKAHAVFYCRIDLGHLRPNPYSPSNGEGTIQSAPPNALRQCRSLLGDCVKAIRLFLPTNKSAITPPASLFAPIKRSIKAKTIAKDRFHSSRRQPTMRMTSIRIPLRNDVAST